MRRALRKIRATDWDSDGWNRLGGLPGLSRLADREGGSHLLQLPMPFPAHHAKHGPDAEDDGDDERKIHERVLFIVTADGGGLADKGRNQGCKTFYEAE